MAAKTHRSADRIGAFLKQYPDLSEDERNVVRNVLQKASYIELAHLLADRELRGGSHEAHDSNSSYDPVLVAFGILGLIAVAALTCVLLQW